MTKVIETRGEMAQSAPIPWKPNVIAQDMQGVA
jgi:hypothetical protein